MNIVMNSNEFSLSSVYLTKKIRFRDHEIYLEKTEEKSRLNCIHFLYFAITIEEASRNDGWDARFAQVLFGGKLSEYDFWRFSGKWLMPFWRCCTRYVCRQPNKPVILVLSIPGHFGCKSNILLLLIIFAATSSISFRRSTIC